jgi:hypothetical protein
VSEDGQCIKTRSHDPICKSQYDGAAKAVHASSMAQRRTGDRCWRSA